MNNKDEYSRQKKNILCVVFLVYYFHLLIGHNRVRDTYESEVIFP